MPNEMTFEQAATFLNALQEQVTGVRSIAAADTSEFVSAATTLLKTGVDPIMNAVNQVLSRTIFSIRPYSAKFRLAEVSDTAYGNHVRKLRIADKPLLDDERYKWPVAYDESVTSNPIGDGQSVDMYKLRKPEILQTNIYGSKVWEDYYTTFKDQLECAMEGPTQHGQFWAMVTQNSVDKLTQYREDAGRAVVLSFIAGLIDEGDEATSASALGHRVIPLITLYNALTGANVTLANVFSPDNMRPFVQFVYSTISTVSDMMTERSVIFQTRLNGLDINQHTEKSRQKLMILSQIASMFETMGVSNTYHDGYLVLPGGVRTESVGFWQSITDPWMVHAGGARILPNGTISTPTMENPVPVVALLYDEDALGYSTTQSWMATTPLNAAGGYWNTFVHETERLFVDHTEKGVVFTLQ